MKITMLITKNVCFINTMLALFMCLTLDFIIQGSLWLLSISLILLVIGYFIEIALTNMVVIEDK